jgi:hypothetical protein
MRIAILCTRNVGSGLAPAIPEGHNAAISASKPENAQTSAEPTIYTKLVSR